MFGIPTTFQANQQSLEEYLTRLSLSFILSVICAICYRVIQKRERITISNLPYTMILFCVIACGMMMAIGDSVAKAFGLVGALSLLRFRMNIQNPTDMAAILLTMTIGISAGISTLPLTVTFTAFSLIVFLSLHLFHLNRFRRRRTLFLQVGNHSAVHEFLSQMKELFKTEHFISSTEFHGKHASWKVQVWFPKSSTITSWEAWLRSDRNLLFTEGLHQMTLDLTEWEPNLSKE